MQFTTLTLAAFAVAAYAGDVTVYTTCTSTRTVERVVATSYVSSNSTSSLPSASPSPYTNATMPAAPTSVLPTQPAEASPTHTNAATALGFQAAGLAAIVGAVGLFLA